MQYLIKTLNDSWGYYVSKCNDKDVKNQNYIKYSLFILLFRDNYNIIIADDQMRQGQ